MSAMMSSRRPAALARRQPFAEGIGGFLIIAGLLTRLVAFLIVCDLGTAVIGPRITSR